MSKPDNKQLVRDLRNIQQVQRNPVGLYRGREELRQQVVNNYVASALKQASKCKPVKS